jgi:hypothetical protein
MILAYNPPRVPAVFIFGCHGVSYYVEKRDDTSNNTFTLSDAFLRRICVMSSA